MLVLAQTFNIMTPSYDTLQLELRNDYERLVRLFQNRSKALTIEEDCIPPPEYITEYLVRPSSEDNKLT